MSPTAPSTGPGNLTKLANYTEQSILKTHHSLCMAHYFLIYPRYQKRCNRNSSLFLPVSFSELKPPDALLLFYSILVYSIEYTLPHVEASSRCCENSGELRAPSAKSNDKRTYHSFVMTYSTHDPLLFGFRFISY